MFTSTVKESMAVIKPEARSSMEESKTLDPSSAKPGETLPEADSIELAAQLAVNDVVGDAPSAPGVNANVALPLPGWAEVIVGSPGSEATAATVKSRSLISKKILPPQQMTSKKQERKFLTKSKKMKMKIV